MLPLPLPQFSLLFSIDFQIPRCCGVLNLKKSLLELFFAVLFVGFHPPHLKGHCKMHCATWRGEELRILSKKVWENKLVEQQFSA